MPAVSNEKCLAFHKQGKPYICLHQNPFVFAWLVLAKYNSLKLNELGLQRNIGVRGLKAIVRYRFWKYRSGKEVWLPVFGHMGLKVHRGYKIFDFKRNVVARIIDRDVAPAFVQNELTGVKTAAELEFAPNIYKWDEKQRWYEEDYIIGEKRAAFDKSSADILFRLFDTEVKSCLKGMLRFKSILRVETKGYLSQILGILEDTRLLDSGLKKSKIEKIKNFLSSNVKRLIEESSAETFIAFSHGDFSLVNMLLTEGRIKVIDWEGAKFRGLLNDFYNFFMTEIYYDRSGIEIAEEVNNLGNNILQELGINSTPSKNQYLRSLYYYRRLYYVERVSMLLQRDITDKSLDVITKSIDIFNRFENKSRN